MVRPYYLGKSPKGRETRSIGLAPCGCGVLTASAQSGPTSDASKGAAPELSLANWDCKCCLFSVKNIQCGLGSRGKVVKSGERRELTLEFFLSNFPPLEGWISDENADLLSLGADEAIAVSARLTLKRRVGVAGRQSLLSVSVSLSRSQCSAPRGERPRADRPSACTAARPAPLLQHPAPRQALNPSLCRQTPLQRCILFMVGRPCLRALEQGSAVVGFPKRTGSTGDGTDTGSP